MIRFYSARLIGLGQGPGDGHHYHVIEGGIQITWVYIFKFLV